MGRASSTKRPGPGPPPEVAQSGPYQKEKDSRKDWEEEWGEVDGLDGEPSSARGGTHLCTELTPRVVLPTRLPRGPSCRKKKQPQLEVSTPQRGILRSWPQGSAPPSLRLSTLETKPRPNIHQDSLVSQVRARLRPMPHYSPASSRQTRAKTWRPKPLGLAQAIPVRTEEEF